MKLVKDQVVLNWVFTVAVLGVTSFPIQNGGYV